MLLKVTTHGSRIFLRVTDSKLFLEKNIKLPAGTYVFRRVANPINPALADWLILDKPQSVFPDLETDAIVGMAYEALMFFNDPFCAFRDFQIEAEEIFEELTTLVTPSKTPILARKIIQLPTYHYPTFVRYHPPKHQAKIIILHRQDRTKRSHPAFRRACCT